MKTHTSNTQGDIGQIGVEKGKSRFRTSSRAHDLEIQMGQRTTPLIGRNSGKGEDNRNSNSSNGCRSTFIQSVTWITHPRDYSELMTEDIRMEFKQLRTELIRLNSQVGVLVEKNILRKSNVSAAHRQVPQSVEKVTAVREKEVENNQLILDRLRYQYDQMHKRAENIKGHTNKASLEDKIEAAHETMAKLKDKIKNLKLKSKKQGQIIVQAEDGNPYDVVKEIQTERDNLQRKVAKLTEKLDRVNLQNQRTIMKASQISDKAELAQIYAAQYRQKSTEFQQQRLLDNAMRARQHQLEMARKMYETTEQSKQQKYLKVLKAIQDVNGKVESVMIKEEEIGGKCQQAKVVIERLEEKLARLMANDGVQLDEDEQTVEGQSLFATQIASELGINATSHNLVLTLIQQTQSLHSSISGFNKKTNHTLSTSRTNQESAQGCNQKVSGAGGISRFYEKRGDKEIGEERRESREEDEGQREQTNTGSTENTPQQTRQRQNIIQSEKQKQISSHKQDRLSNKIDSMTKAANQNIKSSNQQTNTFKQKQSQIIKQQLEQPMLKQQIAIRPKQTRQNNRISVHEKTPKKHTQSLKGSNNQQTYQIKSILRRGQDSKLIHQIEEEPYQKQKLNFDYTLQAKMLKKPVTQSLKKIDQSITLKSQSIHESNIVPNNRYGGMPVVGKKNSEKIGNISIENVIPLPPAKPNPFNPNKPLPKIGAKSYMDIRVNGQEGLQSKADHLNGRIGGNNTKGQVNTPKKGLNSNQMPLNRAMKLPPSRRVPPNQQDNVADNSDGDRSSSSSEDFERKVSMTKASLSQSSGTKIQVDLLDVVVQKALKKVGDTFSGHQQ